MTAICCVIVEFEIATSIYGIWSRGSAWLAIYSALVFPDTDSEFHSMEVSPLLLLHHK